jgi:hypothetical protein
VFSFSHDDTTSELVLRFNRVVEILYTDAREVKAVDLFEGTHRGDCDPLHALQVCQDSPNPPGDSGNGVGFGRLRI